jgi:predicted ATPase
VLAGQAHLIVLDNCEHLLDACARLTETLLRACPRIVILATSRESLRIAGETVLQVPTLHVPDPQLQIGLEDLRGYDAVRLFIDRAAAVQPKFSLTAENARAVAQLCHRLDGIPLAIELAAARVGALSVEQISERLEDRFQLLTTGSRTALPRHQTLRAMVDWSYELLSEPQQALLRGLAVFAGGCTLEAVEAVCNGAPIAPEGVLDALGELVPKSLVIAEESTSHAVRYRMLETFRQYGQLRLQEAGEMASAYAAHARYFADLAALGEVELTGANQLEWLHRFDLERGNFRAVLSRSREGLIAAGSGEALGPALAARLYFFWFKRSHLREAADWYTAMATVAEADSAPGLAAQCRAKAGFFHFQVGDRGLARDLLDSALKQALEADDKVACTWARTDQEAAVLLEEGYELARAYGERLLEANGLGYLGQLSTYRSNYDLATRQLEDSIRLFEALENTHTILIQANALVVHHDLSATSPLSIRPPAGPRSCVVEGSVEG